MQSCPETVIQFSKEKLLFCETWMPIVPSGSGFKGQKEYSASHQAINNTSTERTILSNTKESFFAGIDPNIGSLSSVKSHQSQDPFEGKAKSKTGEREKGCGT